MTSLNKKVEAASENESDRDAPHGSEANDPDMSELSGPLRRKILRRLFGFIFHYPFRVFLGMFLSLTVSLTNLFVLSAFVPIFNALGETGPIKIFIISTREKARLDQNTINLDRYGRVMVRLTRAKMNINERFADKSSAQGILILCAIILPIYFIKILSMIGALYMTGTAGLLAVRDIRMRLFAGLNTMGIQFFNERQTGYIMSRILNDAELVGKSISVEFNDAVNNTFYIITHMAFLALISWKLFILTFFIVPIIIAPVSKFAARIRKATQGQQERLADLGAHIQEILSGIRVIRAFSMENFERQRFSIINNRLFKDTFRGHYFHQVGPALTEFVSSIVVLGFMLWGAYAMMGGDISRGHFFAFFFTLVFLMRPMKQVSVMMNLMASASAAAARIFDLLDTKPGIPEAAKPVPFSGFSRTICYSDVSFRYSPKEDYALKHINFEVQSGETIALVGSSGSGKSTVMDLLPRFYDVVSGTIEIDGINIKDLDLIGLRTSIGVVTQSIFLFNASVRDNIAYGRKDIPLKRIEEVAILANADKFIRQLEFGYDTPMGERGVMLSGGQKQRVAIARALLRDPPILIFDEATSALDNESEMLVQEALDRLLADRTVFIIAHRLSTIQNADRIMVLEEGQIVDQGKHSDLMTRSRLYSKLYDMQFSEEP